jgi:hypothetical protein
MKLYSYILTHDYGLAPNPFWGYCTLAICTPNRMGVRAQEGDWFMGVTSKSKGNCLLYVMEVSEVLSFDDYYRDSRFEKKKPSSSSWKEQCGDNIYYTDSTGVWQRHIPHFFHKGEAFLKKDTRHPRVFIAERFYYFGEKAIKLPKVHEDLILARQGCKHRHSPETVRSFLNWLIDNYQLGINALPRDRREHFEFIPIVQVQVKGGNDLYSHFLEFP